MLHRAKIICSNDTLFLNKVNRFRPLFLVNDYTLTFLNKVLRKFMVKDHFLPDNEKDTDFGKCCVKIPFVGMDYKRFANRLSKLIKLHLVIKLRVIFVTFKIYRYF